MLNKEFDKSIKSDWKGIALGMFLWQIKQGKIFKNFYEEL